MTRFINTFISIFTLSLYLALHLQANAASDFKIITLQHRFAEDILPTIQPLLTQNGTISAMQNHLIIRTTPKNMTEIEQIIARLDIPRQNLKITVRRQIIQNASDLDTNIAVRKRIGNVEISNSERQKNISNGARIHVQDSQSRNQNHTDQFINISDGERAFIRVGQSVPFTREWISLTSHYLGVQRTTEFTDVDTGFAVRPRSIGNQIELEITPRIAKLNQNGFVDFEELSTILRVKRGEWIDLGGTMTHKDDVSRAILSWKNNHESEKNHLSIRVD